MPSTDYRSPKELAKASVEEDGLTSSDKELSDVLERRSWLRDSVDVDSMLKKKRLA